MKKENWKWFGHAGHFICGHWCRFHLCTLVGKYLVSTVGEYMPPDCEIISESESLKKHRFETLGAGPEIYETYVFKAGAPCKSEKCNCGLPEIDGLEVEGIRTMTAGEAAKTHNQLCQKWSKK